MKRIAFLWPAFAILLGAQTLPAQSGGPYTLQRSVVAGIPAASGGGFTATGTTGQPDVQNASGGSFTVNGEIGGAVVIQQPGAPFLTVAGSGTNIVIFWTAPATGFALEENGDLSLTNGWQPVSQNAVTNGGQISVTIPMTSGRKFYRLKN